MKYSYTARYKLENSLQSDIDVYYPGISEVINLLCNRKIPVLQDTFCYNFNTCIGKAITNIKIDTLDISKIYLSFGGYNIHDLTNIGNVTIPCVEYHNVSIHGYELRENDNTTVMYDVIDITEPITTFKIGKSKILVRNGMYIL